MEFDDTSCRSPEGTIRLVGNDFGEERDLKGHRARREVAAGRAALVGACWQWPDCPK